MAAVPFQTLFVLAAALAFGRLVEIPELPWAAALPAWVLPASIFLTLTLNSAIDTLRVLSLARGFRLGAWLAGFSQAALFVTAIAGLLTNLQNPWNVVAFAGGVAFGSVLGIVVEGRLAPGHRLVRIVSSRSGTVIAETLRRGGWGATEFPARGQDGMVTLIWCHVARRDAGAVTEQVLALDPEAFITAQPVRLFLGGWRA
jgi:uncharacterized protein YebE (UPF0316 family)